MAQLVHLNGPPGIGKSTVARAYAERRPGTLNCDVDVLRTMIGGWSEDFDRAGSLIRPAALAFIGGYLAESGDVVFPQMLVNPVEVERFAGIAQSAGASYVEIVLLDEVDDAVARFHRRGADGDDTDWHERIRGIVDGLGGDDLLRDYHRRLLELLALRPQIEVVTSRESHLEETLAGVLAAVDSW